MATKSKQKTQTSAKKVIESKKTEIRYFTSDPKKMLNKWIVSRVLKTYIEDVKDADTGETVSLERNEILFYKGKFIDQDTLQQIQFSMKADGIKEVEVSNQNRAGYEIKNEYIFPYTVQVSDNDKKRKYLLLASSIENATDITRDYLELNSKFGFWINMVKEMDRCYIINDPALYDDVIEDDNISDEPIYDEDGNEIKPVEKKVKFFQIDINIKSQEDIEHETPGTDETFVVQTYTAEDAMVLIRSKLEFDETERIERVKDQAEKNGRKADDEDLKRRHFTLSTLKLGPLPIYDMIPRELSYEYNPEAKKLIQS